MNAIERMGFRGYEGMPYSLIEAVLSDSAGSLKLVSARTRGVLVLNSGKVLKCVCNYFNTKKIVRSGSNPCYYIHDDLGIGGVQAYDCRNCHLICINMATQGKINRKGR